MSGAADTVVVAMSGGVDSSVAALLLARAGHEVIGLTLRLWESGPAAGENDAVEAAGRVASQLGIPHRVVDRAAEFESSVLARAWSEYQGGRTPNPCLGCNRDLKFAALLGEARALGAARIATGHHARVARSAGEPPRLLRGRDGDKDQSYFLAMLRPEQLEAALFPVGELTKAEVRRLAGERGLSSDRRPESQDACFATGEEPLAETLRRRFGAPARPGAVVDPEGRTLGSHPGVHRFTIGQRHGLGVALGRPAYVVAIRAETAEIVVSDREEVLRAGGLRAAPIQWLPGIDPASVHPFEVQIRYRHAPVPCRLRLEEPGSVRVLFDRPQRAVTPGQAAVFYQGDRVIGGGWIAEPLEVGA